MTIEWTDTTSFSQGEKNRTPRVWTTRLGPFRLTVHRHIHYPKEQWLMSTAQMLFDCEQLASPDIEEAKCQAVAMLQAACQQVIDEIGESVKSKEVPNVR